MRPMEKKFLDLQVKAAADGRTVIGYGAVFGNVDRGGDVVMPGAFAKSIASGRKARMLWQHDPSKVIGCWRAISEDEKGLRLEGVLSDTPKGNEVATLLKDEAIEGLSIGYRVTDDEWKEDGTRLIKEAELWEVSIVTFPMNESATVDAVKAAEMSRRDVERKLTQDAGFSRSVARALLSGGYDAIAAKHDADDESERELIERLNAWSKI